MAVSIVHIGLPLDHLSIPVEERPAVATRLRELQAGMTRAGYAYAIIHASLATGLDGFRRRLRTQPCDGALIGGGVVGDPATSHYVHSRGADWMAVGNTWVDTYYDAAHNTVATAGSTAYDRFGPRNLDQRLAHEGEHLLGANHVPGAPDKTPDSQVCSGLP